MNFIIDELLIYYHDNKWQVSKPICLYFHMKSWVHFSDGDNTFNAKNFSYRNMYYDSLEMIAEWEAYLDE